MDAARVFLAAKRTLEGGVERGGSVERLPEVWGRKQEPSELDSVGVIVSDWPASDIRDAHALEFHSAAKLHQGVAGRGVLREIGRAGCVSAGKLSDR